MIHVYMIIIILLICGLGYKVHLLSETVELNAPKKIDIDMLIDGSFSLIDARSEVFDAILSIKTTPYKWCFSNCNIIRDDGMKIWTANDIQHRRFEDDQREHLKLSMIEKEMLNLAILELTKWKEDNPVNIDL